MPARNPLPVEPAAKDGSAIAKWLLIGAALLAMVLGAGAWFWHQRTAAPGILSAPSGPVLPVVPVPVRYDGSGSCASYQPDGASRCAADAGGTCRASVFADTGACASTARSPPIVAPAPAAIKPVPKASVAKPVKPAIRPDPAAKSPSAAPEHGQSSTETRAATGRSGRRRRLPRRCRHGKLAAIGFSWRCRFACMNNAVRPSFKITTMRGNATAAKRGRRATRK